MSKTDLSTGFDQAVAGEEEAEAEAEHTCALIGIRDRLHAGLHLL